MDYLYNILNKLSFSTKPQELSEFKKPDGYKNINTNSIKNKK
jgi:hypothetical protein